MPQKKWSRICVCVYIYILCIHNPHCINIYIYRETGGKNKKQPINLPCPMDVANAPFTAERLSQVNYVRLL